MRITNSELDDMLNEVPDHRDDLRRDIEQIRLMVARFDWEPPDETIQRLRSTLALYKAEASIDH